jgi:hypothetical protein
MPAIVDSKLRKRSLSFAARCSLIARSVACAADSSSALMVAAVAPISSLQSAPNIATAFSPSANRRMTSVMTVIGRETPMVRARPAHTLISTATTSVPMTQSLLT